MIAFRLRYAAVSLLIAVFVVLVPGTCLADWVERQQPLAHAIFVPKGYDSARKYPVVVVIHGNGCQGNDNRVYKGEFYAKHLADAKIQEEQPHFIYVPQCPAEQTWVAAPWEKGSYSVGAVAASQPMTKLTSILTGLLKEFSIDTNRIYVIGISMGGQATWDLLCRNPGLFAAAVPICGCGDPSKAGLLKNVGIWAFHGSEDSTVPVKSDREIMASLEKEGVRVLRLTDADPLDQPKEKHIYSEYNVGHNVWDKACGLSRYVVPWLFGQSRDKTVVAGGATLRLGMTKAEVMDQMAKTPAAGWYVPEQDSPPTDELYKMDKWGLAYKNPPDATLSGGIVTLIFVNEKVANIDAGGSR